MAGFQVSPRSRCEVISHDVIEIYQLVQFGEIQSRNDHRIRRGCNRKNQVLPHVLSELFHQFNKIFFVVICRFDIISTVFCARRTRVLQIDINS